MVFKKDLTPLSKKGTVIKRSGKGSTERQPDVMARITNRYPKQPVAPPAPAPAPGPMGPLPGMLPPEAADELD
jgi:hypothetical protein